MAAAAHHQQNIQMGLQVSYRMLLASLLNRKPKDQLNADTEFPSVAYYLTRHKTTGAMQWMSILHFLLCVYTALSVLQNLSPTTTVPRMTMYHSNQSRTCTDMQFNFCVII